MPSASPSSSPSAAPSGLPSLGPSSEPSWAPSSTPPSESAREKALEYKKTGNALLGAGDFSGAASLQIVTDDLGHSGAGGGQTDTDLVSITVAADNDAPVNNVPGAQSTLEDTTLTFSSSGGNLISISDLDAGASPVEVTLTASNGDITLSGTTGLTFSTGDGTAVHASGPAGGSTCVLSCTSSGWN